MKKTLIITVIVLGALGFAAKEAIDMFNSSPLGAVKQLNDRKEAIEEAIKDPTTLIEKPEIKLQ
tara:strand:+ start:525 stop:716 length:192 start_codon:yes stop_codon:yes gene_type:complete